MAGGNWRPTRAADPAAVAVAVADPAAAAVAEPAAAAAAGPSVGRDWRAQLPPEARRRIVSKIMETLKKHLPVLVPEGLSELQKIAVRFEEKIYTAAPNQSDYLRKISLKILSMESQTKTQQNPGNAQVIPNKNPPGPASVAHAPDMEIDSDSGGGGGGQGRVHQQGGQREEAANEAVPVELPEDMQRQVLTLLPLRDAICMGAVARSWRHLWKSRWHRDRSSVEIHLRSRGTARRELDVLESEAQPRRRLDRFSLVVERGPGLKPAQLQRFINYSTDCRVEDLHVGTARKDAWPNIFLARLSPHLARLSLRGICISGTRFKREPFRALEVVLLHSVFIDRVAFETMMRQLCPSLRTLDLRGCSGHYSFYEFPVRSWPEKLRSVTVDKCVSMNLDWASRPTTLRSFRYIGSYPSVPFYLPHTLVDLYICCSNYSNNKRARVPEEITALPVDLPYLTVLTICSNTLKQRASSLPHDGTTAELLMSNLKGLRELQLLMLEMEAANLSDIFVFLKTCQCPNLERLFVQLLAFSHEPTDGSLDEVGEVSLPKDGLDKLVMVKIINFNWRRVEVQLVILLLRKARSLHKLLLVSPNVIPPPNVPGIKESDLLLLRESLAKGQILLRESDDAATQPFHSEVFLEI